MPNFSLVLDQIFRESYVYGHIPYALFALSALMRDIRWLRIVAVIAGTLRIYLSARVVYDPVTVTWESTLVLLNAGQLFLIWWDGRHKQMSEDEAFFIRSVLPDETRTNALALLATAECKSVAPDEVLTLEGHAVPRLLFVTDGAARIERSGRMVAVCSRGDFLGEMSFVSGGVASATAIADKPMRVISFDNARLHALLTRNIGLRRALEASFNRNLTEKLHKATSAPVTAAAEPA